MMSTNSSMSVTPVVAAQPLAISADGSALLQHTADEDDHSKKVVTGTAQFGVAPGTDAASIRAAFRTFFDIVPTAQFIVKEKCERVGLQFPDELLQHGTGVVRELQQEVDSLREAQLNETKAASANEPSSLPTTSSTTTAAPVTSPSSSPKCQFYLLADTSYGSCCVDEVAAQHANCDLIVHYGFSCLSSTRRLPVRYVFGRKPLNIDTMITKVFDDLTWQPESATDSSSSFSFSTPPPSTPTVDPTTLPPVCLLFFYNLEYAYLVEDGDLPNKIAAYLQTRTGTGRKYVAAIARVQQEQSRSNAATVSILPSRSSCATSGGSCGCSCNNHTSSTATTTCATCSCTPSSEASCTPVTIASPSTSSSTSSYQSAATSHISAKSQPPLVFTSFPSSEPLDTFHLNGYSFAFPHSLVTTKEAFERIQIIWIGSDVEYKLLANSMLNYNSNTFHLYNPLTSRLQKEIKSKSKTLARRYYLMEKAKNAEIVGILVGTLGVANYLDVIQYLKRLLHNAGKKAYLFVVGKLNEPKLSNFGEIDLFVLVACSLNTMFDSTGYYRDVITPFELNCALKGIEWNGDYHTEFQTILPSAATSTTASSSTLPPSVSVANANVDGDDDDDDSLSNDLAVGMRFDPITGKMRAALPSQLYAAGIRLHQEDEEGDLEAETSIDSSDSGALITRDSQQLVRVEGGALVQFKQASDHFLSSRTFTGLVLKHPGEEDQAVATVEPGLSGIARNYQTTQLPPPTIQTQPKTQ